jgi:hypothetical protein
MKKISWATLWATFFTGSSGHPERTGKFGSKKKKQFRQKMSVCVQRQFMKGVRQEFFFASCLVFGYIGVKKYFFLVSVIK